MDIFTQVKSLGLPQGEYVVVGSGAMSARGIRMHNDIDILVTKKLYEGLRNHGWKVKKVNSNFEVVEKDIFEASPDMITLVNYNPDPLEIIRRADIINGIPFSTLADVMDFKRSLGREKDMADIKLIQEYEKLVSESVSKKS